VSGAAETTNNPPEMTAAIQLDALKRPCRVRLWRQPISPRRHLRDQRGSRGWLTAASNRSRTSTYGVARRGGGPPRRIVDLGTRSFRSSENERADTLARARIMTPV
jgi:hypothetical protein